MAFAITLATVGVAVMIAVDRIIDAYDKHKEEETKSRFAAFNYTKP